MKYTDSNEWKLYTELAKDRTYSIGGSYHHY